ncbi:DUF4127 family protein [Paenibacillus mendelii]|uniref:DUF4127 family protein n=1 Tax=Paenibacillus mendelii TaxID=206163 RepID=A0ABV6JBV2_9BACL|nr:DUF4127 family protein [Paenibacillus mendelii]MCQ6562899.1 DUF4127 family protein [Paenibacillus mendelii]
MNDLVYVPLDERPCNYEYPAALARIGELPLTSPPLHLLGNKKRPADTTGIMNWLIESAQDANDLVVSIDMLVYGGIVPSRLHHHTEEECLQRLSILRELKAAHPSLRIHAFNLIMRTPSYNSDDEEPAYYEQHGESIYRYSWLSDKRTYGELPASEQAEWERLHTVIPQAVLTEHLQRRSVNAFINEASVKFVHEGIIDTLIIPLDDNAEYGFTASERNKLIVLADSLNLSDRIHIYPGADEVGCTLIARVFCERRSYRPELFTRYSSTLGPTIIPCLEDRTLGESIKSQVIAAGGLLADNSHEADFILMVHSPAAGQNAVADAASPLSSRHRSYFSEVNIREFAAAIQNYMDKGRTVALADVAALNGSDQSLMQLLSRLGLLSRLQAYAGWNTSGNTLGTVIAHGIIESYYSRPATGESVDRMAKSRAFLIARLIEDWGYQAIVRSRTLHEHLPLLGGNYFNVAECYDAVTELVRDQLKAFVHTYLQDLQPERIEIHDVRMPWKRMFEVGFQVSLTDSPVENSFS